MRTMLDDAEAVLGSPLRNLATILVFVLCVVVLATLGYMAAGWSLLDSAYMVLLTIYTVGYGEVRPIDTPYLHLVTIGTMALGCTGMILLTSALVQVFTVFQIRQLFGANRMQDKIAKLTGHVVICGYGRIGTMLAQELTRAGMPFLIVERGTEKRGEAEAAGYLTLAGDATEEEVLVTAGIQRARALATVLPDDAANVFITLSARNLNDRLEIIARGEASTTERKLLHAGADRVIFPTHIGAEAIARMILYPNSEMLSAEAEVATVRRELERIGLELEQVTAAPDSALCGKSVAEAERQSGGTLFVVQIDRASGQTIPRPAPDEVIGVGDRITIVMRDAAAAAHAVFASAKPSHGPRGPLN